MSPVDIGNLFFYAILPAFSMCFMARINWVDRNRIAIYNKMNYEELCHFNEEWHSFSGMVFRFWIWDITKLKRK